MMGIQCVPVKVLLIYFKKLIQLQNDFLGMIFLQNEYMSIPPLAGREKKQAGLLPCQSW